MPLYQGCYRKNTAGRVSHPLQKKCHGISDTGTGLLRVDMYLTPDDYTINAAPRVALFGSVSEGAKFPSLVQYNARCAESQSWMFRTT